MLRITVHASEAVWRMQLEGKLAGAWAKQAADTWRSAQPSGSPVEIDLTGVTVVDEAGLELLKAMKQSGAHFHAKGVEMKAMVGEMASAPSCESVCGWVRHLLAILILVIAFGPLARANGNQSRAGLARATGRIEQLYAK